MNHFVVLVGDLAAYAADNPRTPAKIRKYAEVLVADDTNELEAADLKLVLDLPMTCSGVDALSAIRSIRGRSIQRHPMPWDVGHATYR